MLRWISKNKTWLFSGAVVGYPPLVAAAITSAIKGSLNNANLLLGILLLNLLFSIVLLMVQLVQGQKSEKLVKRLLENGNTKLSNSIDEIKQRIDRNELYLQEQIKVVENRLKEIEIPPRYKNWDEAQPKIRSLIGELLSSDEEETTIECLGVALHVSWKTVRECIENYYTDTKRLPRAVIKLKVLAPDWPGWVKLGNNWKRRNEDFWPDIVDFLEQIGGSERLRIEVAEYEYPPNWHGVLVGQSNLFRSSCLYRDNEFMVHKNPYVYFLRHHNEYADLQLQEFKYWFAHESKKLSLDEMKKHAEHAL